MSKFVDITVALEDIETVLDAAEGEADEYERTADMQGSPTKTARYRAIALQTRAAMSRIRAAIGEEHV